MAISCPHCNGKISPNKDKIGLVFGGGILISAIAMIFGLTGGGIIVLAKAALGGSALARHLLKAKLKLMQTAGEKCFFICDQCKTQIAVKTVWDQVFSASKRESGTGAK